jgi:hypothetical protein
MGLNPNALYTCLLDDLASVIGPQRLLDLELYGPGPDASHSEMSCWSAMKACLKKFQPRSSHEQDSAALSKFSSVNQRCKTWEAHEDIEYWQEALLGEFKRAIYEFLNPYGYALVDDPRQLLDFGRCGPGASIEARGGDSYTKLFSSPLSCTSYDLYTWYRRYVSNFTTWRDAELFRNLHFGEAHIVAGNRLSFVPKDDKISRCICVEPTLNMFYQLGLGHILERRLHSFFGIDMSVQPEKNRKLAHLGSSGIERLVTIDLSSASDSISMRMLEWCLPGWFFNQLKRYRSSKCQFPNGLHEELYMVSTMGNGFTFPLQTMLFSCMVLAASRLMDVKLHHPRGDYHGNWGVFGDDIICPTEIVRQVMFLIDYTGFVINRDKTFVEGPFRESCGADFFRGRNIRGVYVKKLDTIQDRYAVLNQFNLFSARTGIPLRKTVRLLARTVPFNRIPFFEDDSAGIRVPESMTSGLPLSIETQSVLYTRYEAIGRRIRIIDSALVLPRGAKTRIYNPDGLMISFLQRSVNACAIGVRHDIVKYRRKRVSTPYWLVRKDGVQTCRRFS